MPETITAYTTFSPNTKAKSSEVNANLSNHRGTLVPINTDTASASDLTHNLGSDEHRWLNAYVGKIDFETSTTTASLVLQGVYTTTGSGFTAGCAEFLVEGETAAMFTPNGVVGKFRGTTSTASIGQIASSENMSAGSDFAGITAVTISGSTLTISSVGAPIMVMLSRGTASEQSHIRLQHNTATGGNANQGVVELMNGATTIGAFLLASGQTGGNQVASFPLGIINTIYQPGAGTHTLYLRGYTAFTAGGSATFHFRNMRLLAWEL